jgi:hypothetical protein
MQIASNNMPDGKRRHKARARKSWTFGLATEREMRYSRAGLAVENTNVGQLDEKYYRNRGNVNDDCT